MSPLGALLMRAVRACCAASAGFVALVMGYELWARAASGTLSSASRQDIAFGVVLLIMLAGFLWLVRSITKELAKSRT